MNGQTDSAVIVPTNRPRVTAPPANPAVSSIGVSGGVRKSGVSPIILACRIEDEELAKALLSTDIMIRPGAMNSGKATSATTGRVPCTATTNTSM